MTNGGPFTSIFLTGIVDWGEVARHYGKVFEDQGGDIHLNFKVNQILENPHGGKAVQIRGDHPDEVHIFCNSET